MSGSFLRCFGVRLEGGDDSLGRDPAAGHELATGLADGCAERGRPLVLPDEHRGGVPGLDRLGQTVLVREATLRNLDPVLGRVPTAWILRGPFAFRPTIIRPTPAIHVASTSGQIVLFWRFFLVVIPLAIAVLERRWAVSLPFPPVAGSVGVAVLALASALGLWSAGVMSTLGDGTPLPSAMPSRLVIAGPYRRIRNPMAVAGVLQGAAVGLILQSWLVAAYAVVGSVVWNYVVGPLEESDLKDRFGEEFQHYRDTVRCWIPQVSKTQRPPRR